MGNMASDPGRVTLSHEKLRSFRPELYEGPCHCILNTCRDANPSSVAWHLSEGDSRAAVVISVKPELLVAAYSDEIDCVAMLKFPQELVNQHKLTPGSRLLTVNTYLMAPMAVVPDLTAGPRNYGRFQNMIPLIADFLTDDMARINARKRGISEEEWQRAHYMGNVYIMEFPGKARDGTPGYTGKPAFFRRKKNRAPTKYPPISH